MAQDKLPTIDPEQLAAITGGATTGGATSPNDQIQLMLESILSAIKQLAANQTNSGSDSFMQMLPIFMMMRGQQQQAAPPPPVLAPPPGGGWTRVA